MPEQESETTPHDRAQAWPRGEAGDVTVRHHGPVGQPVVVLHGGPGAIGGARLLAEALADPLHVLEPLQRASGPVPLTVARHIDDLAAVLARWCAGTRPLLVGESWGAMLALAFAAAHPNAVGGLALVGCGTFDARARAQLQATLAARTSPDLAARIAAVADAADAHALQDGLYTYRRAIADPVVAFDMRGHEESWADMLRLQADGTYPTAFARITCPVLMLHGTYDPHPGELIRDGLRAFMPQLEYVAFERCGHAPWVEAHARVPFLETLRAWLLARADAGARRDQRLP